ncbi:alpha/beta fold hydrolase [Williamsia sp. CHRR-6]|uniref:alpha/beta fold hydrolase n=1 Tax=Williamsia sp. CHRR-6 TaxID=2835871 RepID=UPI001BDB66CE|nr:alpha/beta fold hydrolase [Williamsia sp. CHRR-6]MBT0566649.1 alpha/beta fold hydrolase [Williamsia sp. CHRR-6]
MTDIRTGHAPVGELNLAYEDHGDLDAPPVLLIMGLSAQLTGWPDGFCARLVDHGYRVIRFDNRDIGLSTHLTGVRVGGSAIMRMLRTEFGLPSPVPYTVVDMADDAVGVLDHLGIERAHIVGGSMGGMIAQVVAGKHRHRTRSVGILFSSTLQRLLPPPHPRQLLAMLSGPGKNATRQDYIENSADALQKIGSPGYPLDRDAALELAATYYDRAHNPAGVVRQAAAVMGTGSLLPHARAISAPTVVIHGTADRLMPPSGGKAIAKAVRHSRLVLIDGMGHDLPEPLWPQITDELVATFRAGG